MVEWTTTLLVDRSSRGLSELSDEMLALARQAPTLRLSNNRLEALPPSLGTLAQLQTLACSGNLLRGLPPEIGGLRALQRSASRPTA